MASLPVDELMQRDADVISMSDFVDVCLKGDYMTEDCLAFWKNVLKDTTTQQT